MSTGVRRDAVRASRSGQSLGGTAESVERVLILGKGALTRDPATTKGSEVQFLALVP